MILTLNEINKKYDIIYSDPPWQQTKGNERECRPNQGKELDYSTMIIDEIKEFHKPLFTNNTNKKHNIFMWTIEKFLHETEQMMKELGYNLHTGFIWDKENDVAPEFTSYEYLLWFYQKGNILMPCESVKEKYTAILREQSTKHSKKPVCAYEMIENMFPNTNKIELFARNEREGWDSFGNELVNI